MRVTVNYLDPSLPPVRVGTLADVPGSGRIVFEYDAAWRNSGLELSPMHLPNRLAGANGYDSPAFQGLFGLFFDSLPDRWGMQLARLRFEEKGRNWNQVSPLELLSYRGNRCMGALGYEPDTGDEPSLVRDVIDLRELAQQARLVEEGSAQSILPVLERAGGSAGGMRPKAVIGLHPDADTILTGVDELPTGFEHWLLKFDTMPQREYGRAEHAYALMARASGITVPDSKLIETRDANGQRQAHFAVKRFDRDGNRRVHFHTFAGLAHRDFNKLDVDYDELLTLCTSLTQRRANTEEMFRRAVFNVLAGNGDDHAKNHGFLMGPDGSWRLSPAYDLTWSQPQMGRRATAVLGDVGFVVPKKKLRALADNHELKNAPAIISQVEAAIARWPEHAAAADLSPAAAAHYQKRLQDLNP